MSDRGQHNQVPDAEVIVDPRGRTYAIGAPTSSHQGHHDGCDGAEHNLLPDVNILSDHIDLVPDRGQHGARQDQVPDADVVVEPGGLNLKSKCHHRSYGGSAGGHSRSRGHNRGHF